MVKSTDRKAGGETEQRGYRLPVALLERVRAYQEREQAKLPPGLVMNETAAIVALLMKALDRDEAAAPRKPKK